MKATNVETMTNDLKKKFNKVNVKVVKFRKDQEFAQNGVDINNVDNLNGAQLDSALNDAWNIINKHKKSLDLTEYSYIIEVNPRKRKQ